MASRYRDTHYSTEEADYMTYIYWKTLSIKVMNEIQQAAQAIVRADALLIGASNGLSIAEGYHVFANNEMFRCQFGDFQ